MSVLPSQEAGPEEHVAVSASVNNAATLILNERTGRYTYTAAGSIWLREGDGLEGAEEACSRPMLRILGVRPIAEEKMPGRSKPDLPYMMQLTFI